MEIGEIIKYLEFWAPPGASWDRDNAGLQVGNTKQKLKNIFLCLELTDKALKEAITNNCNFIFSHHPLIFKPLKKIDLKNDNNAKLIEALIKNDITLYSAHTNLDFTKDGVSFELAKTLELKNIKFLDNLQSNQFKIIVFVPEKSANNVSEAMFSAGAGQIGEYNKCSFTSKGIGTFQGSGNSNPAAGSKLVFEKAEEIKIEVLVHSWNLNNVINTLIKAHPYEQPAYDVISVQNRNVNFGMGAIGTLEKSISTDEFLNHICKKLNTKNVRFAKGKNTKIFKVAVCGGSGSELLNKAIKEKADAFVTADIKYHNFHDGENEILLVDAGHYETEVYSLNAVKKYVENYVSGNGEDIKVFKCKGSTNPVKFYNN
jgi:dinuclear metal center YbgI/SA1388 family protein